MALSYAATVMNTGGYACIAAGLDPCGKLLRIQRIEYVYFLATAGKGEFPAAIVVFELPAVRFAGAYVLLHPCDVGQICVDDGAYGGIAIRRCSGIGQGHVHGSAVQEAATVCMTGLLHSLEHCSLLIVHTAVEKVKSVGFIGFHVVNEQSGATGQVGIQPELIVGGHFRPACGNGDPGPAIAKHSLVKLHVGILSKLCDALMTPGNIRCHKNFIQIEWVSR